MFKIKIGIKYTDVGAVRPVGAMHPHLLFPKETGYALRFEGVHTLTSIPVSLPQVSWDKQNDY